MLDMEIADYIPKAKEVLLELPREVWMPLLAFVSTTLNVSGPDKAIETLQELVKLLKGPLEDLGDREYNNGYDNGVNDQ